MFDVLKTDLKKLNSMTKYPSILTYHAIGDKGRLCDELTCKFDDDEAVIVTEKIDGTNARIICLPDGNALVGSREDLLWSRSDLIFNPSMGIVQTVREMTGRMFLPLYDSVTVIFGEVYGKGTAAGYKNYTTEGRTGFRVFDVATINNYDEILGMEHEKIAQWRNHGGQQFLRTGDLSQFSLRESFDLVPTLAVFCGREIPTDLNDTNDWLLTFAESRCGIDGTGKGIPEGVVIRNNDRSKIAKIRREDYARTLRK